MVNGDSSSAEDRPAARQRRTWPQRLVIVVNLVAISAAVLLAAVLRFGYQQAADVERVQLASTLTAAPEASPGDRVFNLLLVGYDSSAGLDPDDPIQEGRQGERFGDVIIVAHIDEITGTAALLSFPRDLWVPIAGLDREAKINTAFSVGGPATLIESIEEHFDIPINHYASVDFAGFRGLVDAVGTVDVSFDQPARDWNANPSSGPPRSQTGFLVTEPGCVPLDPTMALAYVRSRFYQVQEPDGRWVETEPPSDLGRIIRQQDFLRRLMQKAIDRGARNPFVLADLIETSLENVTIDQDLTPQLFIDVARTFESFEPGELETYSYPAVFGWEGTASVLYGVDDEAAPILEIFRGAAPTDPITVGVSVVGASDDAERAMEISNGLRNDGFRVEGPTPSEVGVGLVVRHGTDGRQAAGLVAASLGDQAVLESVTTLSGRNVIVVVGADPGPVDPGASTVAPVEPAPSTAPGPVSATDHCG